MRLVSIATLTVAVVLIFSFPVPHGLTVSFLDVGQGDAILIESPTGVRVLVDGGATKSVLRELGAAVPFFDRSLDAVVATHPDQDHVGGLSDVIERYAVGIFLESGVTADTSAVAALERALKEKHTTRLVARRGMRLMLGGGAYADILFPDRDVSKVEPNTASVVMRVVYGGTAFVLSGDAPSSIERYLTTIYGSALAGDVLKAGHHGSKTSSDETFVKAVAPEYVVYSRGCDNRYGHPAPEVVALFRGLGIFALDTCESGTVTFRSNGSMLTRR